MQDRSLKILREKENKYGKPREIRLPSVGGYVYQWDDGDKQYTIREPGSYIMEETLIFKEPTRTLKKIKIQ